ncbi:peptidoglycan DD-metalloendopeptidase family protein [uncultured Sphaerotilus sp.]|uniref:peptidoglycan DD-metalloendopeptidase family protein n=1 Tax=uncultured Sphaerotilus sp. TaxID=474984 RepID=UPI0030CA2F6B
MTTPPIKASGFRLLICSVLALTLVGCASHLRPPAPVDHRGGSSRPVTTETERVLPGAENAGKPGYYMVKPGDTLIRVGLESGQNWRDIQRWNQLDNPDLIEVGQVLRVVPPGQDPTQVATRPVVTPRIETRPIDAKPAPVPPVAPTTSAVAAAAAAAASAAGTAPASAPVAASAATPAPAPAAAPAREGDDNVNWMWPAQGSIVSSFEDTRSKGVAIGGKLGDPVYAAADGRVVYAGSGLRGYGNLVIIKHNETLLTAYAHNQTLLVREDQVVRRGQKIAEMGSSDTDRVKLHFEVRRRGKPIDPTKVLPAR